MNNDYHIVAFDKHKHAKDAAEVLASSFSHDHWPFWQHSAFRFTQDINNLMAGLCDLNFVLEEKSSGKVYGQIFCMAPASPRLMLRSLPLILKIILLGLSGLYFFKKVAWQHVFAMRHFYAFMKQHPSNKPHYEVLLFAMHEEMQGKGFGGRLMDAAVKALYERGAQSVVLLTDSTMSWRFYEKYGYQRTLDVSLGPAYKIAMNSDKEHGYAYELDIANKVEAMSQGKLEP